MTSCGDILTVVRKAGRDHTGIQSWERLTCQKVLRENVAQILIHTQRCLGVAIVPTVVVVVVRTSILVATSVRFASVVPSVIIILIPCVLTEVFSQR